MNIIPAPQVAPVQALPLIEIDGTDHAMNHPAKNAAYRLAYLLIMQNYHPVTVARTLGTVFGVTKLLTPDECGEVARKACYFAGCPVEGMA